MPLVMTKSFTVATYEKGDPKSDTVALLLPGRLDTKDYAHMRGHVDFLAAHGHYAVALDPPGSWESPGDISTYTTTNTLKAIDELIEYFGNKPTILMGHSRGGSNAMFAGMKNPRVTHFAAIMSHIGPSTLGAVGPGGVSTSSRDMPPGTSRTNERKQFELPYAYFEDQKRYDATAGLKSCTKPKLFFFGTEDTLIPEESVRKMYNTSASPKIIHKLQGAVHDYRLQPEIIAEINDITLKFLNTYTA